MRGGPLAERRVIDLLNRRFIAFYFNIGKSGSGYDADAAALIAEVDPRFGGRAVPTPPVWVFTPDLKLLGTIDNYAPKDAYFEALRGFLRKHPDSNAMSEDEKKGIGGKLWEELGEYDKARDAYASGGKPESSLGLARIARYEKQWDEAERRLSALTGKKGFEADLAMERAYSMLAKKDYAKAKATLVEAIKAYPRAKRLGELHFYAGVANFFLDQRDWANFHWGWVMENLPEDYNYMRCYFAASADAMPYPNPELGGYRSKGGMVTHDSANRARAKAMEDYQRLKGEF